MFYGHLDKQPYNPEEWTKGGPTNPLREGDLLYGRGTSDDGYSVFSALLAVKAIQEAGSKNPRVVMVLETEEESSSDYLLYLLDKAATQISNPDYLFCLDSGCLDYSRLWLTTSTRGIIEA
jgi:acetylornithine deacetylase/succinyl-diaminopimelate desuccinylase-like protein